MIYRKYVVICLFSLASLCVLSETNLAQRKPAAKPAGLGAVKRFVGKAANDKVIANAAVKKELIALMGARRYRLLDHYTLVQSGVDMISGDVVASGCAPHECMEKSAIVVVDADGRKIHAAIFENPTLTIYSNEKNFDYLPNGLTDWARILVQKQAEYGVEVQIIGTTTTTPKETNNRTTRGILCNEVGGSGGATYSFQTSQGILAFTFFYGGEPRGISSKKRLTIGSEFIIKYSTEDDGGLTGKSFVPTGKTKKVKVCEEF